MGAKELLTTFTTLVLLHAGVHAQVREKFDSRHPSTKEVAMSAEKHDFGDLRSAHVTDFLDLDPGGPEITLAVVRFRSPAKGVFWVTLPRTQDPVPHRIVSVVCEGKSQVEGQPAGDDGRAWSFSGCTGKTPRFHFVFEGGERISIKPDNPPGRATKGAVGLIFWDWKGGGIKAFGKTAWGDRVALTDVDGRLKATG